MYQPTILVTGASQGLGAAIASAAAANGAQVVLAARNTSALENLAQEITQRGGRALAVTADVSCYADCQKIIQQAVQAYAHIDALINCAAVIEPLVPLADVTYADWAHLVAVDLLGPVMICQLAIPYLRQTHGRVINLTSGAAEIAIPEASAYCTAKAALNHFSRVLAAEEPEITVLLFKPGEVNTSMQEQIRSRINGKAPNPIYQYLQDLYEQGQLLPPETPALAAVGLALQAPHEWSGETLTWDDEKVQSFSRNLVMKA